jgi:hypothetical protein
MANVLELILKATDQVSGTLKNIEQTGGSTASAITSHWKEIGAASAVAAAGIEVMARKVGELNEATDKLSTISGVTSTELNEIARSVAGAGDSIGEVLDVMTSGAKQGLESGQALEQYAAFWDLVGDAAGENSAALADASVSLAGFGITAENVGDSAGAFGYILNETSLSISEFLGICAKAGPEVEGLGLSVDDMAIILDSLEARGITGRKAISAISEAAELANGDVAAFEQALGLTTGTLATAEQATGTYTTKLNDMAVAHEENLTVFERMSSYIGELQYKFGDLIVQTSALAPALVAIGPGIKIFDTLKTAISGAGGVIPLLTTGFGTIVGAIGPLLPLIIGLAAAAALLYAAWQTNFLGIRDITAQAGDFIKERFASIKETFAGVGDAIAPSISKLKESFGNLYSSLDNLFQKFTGGVSIVQAVSAAFTSLGKIADILISAFGGLLVKAITTVADALSALADFAADVVDWFARLADNPIVAFFADLAQGAYKAGSAFLDTLLPGSEKTASSFDNVSSSTDTLISSLNNTTGATADTASGFTTLATQGTDSMTSLAGSVGTSCATINASLTGTIGTMQNFAATATQTSQAAMQAVINQLTNGVYENYNPGDFSTWADMSGGVPATNYDMSGVNPNTSGVNPSAGYAGVQSLDTNQYGYYWTDGEGVNHYANFDLMNESQNLAMDITPNGWSTYYLNQYGQWQPKSGVSGGTNPYNTMYFDEALSLFTSEAEIGMYSTQDLTDAMADTTEQTEAMTYAAEDLTDATSYAMDAAEDYSSSLYDSSDASDIATSSQGALSGSLYDTTTAAGITLSAMDTMGTGMVTGMNTTGGSVLGSFSNLGLGMISGMNTTGSSVLGTFGSMGTGAVQSTGYISSVMKNMFNSITTQAQSALAAITGTSTTSTTSGGCTGGSCGSVTPGSGIYDMGDSWTIDTDYSYIPWGSSSGTTSGDGLPSLPDSWFPWLAEGGDVTKGGYAVVGERGPEFLHLPQGASVTPLGNRPSITDHIEEVIARHEAARDEHQKEWATKIVNKVVSRLGHNASGGDVHLHGVFIADKSGLMRLQKELENVKILEDTRRGRRVTA